MKLVLHSERLTLRPFAESDLDIAIAMFTDPAVLKYAGGAQTEAWVRRGVPDWVRRGADGHIGIWCITIKETGEKLGSVALLPMPVDDDDTDFSLVAPGMTPDNDIEVGYFLKRTAWGKGYATEACRRIIDFAFERSPLTEVVATFDDDNLASQHVLSKCGFTDNGKRRCYGEDDSMDYRITRTRWQKLRDSR